ncbi:DUF5615 family PIN-like protein [Chlorobium sp. KB01]|uniref:DUF5615 family PIN-like protein n=1 Tax=Chlorobium sp. KB01 TaxID=1917528 RepID=UPI001E54C3FC|nr:DUF5615 family PIN-like protein [Chlorobium sp. KB01]
MFSNPYLKSDEPEIFPGIALLPEGTRRKQLTDAAEKMFSADFSQRCLPFDNHSAVEYAELLSKRLRNGKPVSTEDAQIAAIAVTNKLILVTRNTKDFVEIDDLMLVNPWETT